MLYNRTVSYLGKLHSRPARDLRGRAGSSASGDGAHEAWGLLGQSQ